MKAPVILAAGALSCALATAAPSPVFFAMDTGTDAGRLNSDAQAAMARDLGFDGIGPTYTTPEALRGMIAALDEHKLQLPAIYLGFDLDAEPPIGPAFADALAQLRGRPCVLWVYIQSRTLRPSDPAGDARAAALLRPLAEQAAAAGLRVALYPHAGFWMERVEDTVRLARRVDHPSLGVTFNLCHWMMTDGTELEARLDAAMPHLFVVTLNGADEGAKSWAKLIQPLDAGTFDVGRLLRLLRRKGYTGPFGLQHFGIGGDARTHLERSMTAWRHLHETTDKAADPEQRVDQ